MPALKVVYFPDAPLTETAAPVESFDTKLVQLADNMIETMRKYEGVGLAAPQVGVRKRLFVVCAPEGEPMCLVNPEILESEGSEEGEEGCLSMPTIYAQVKRATWIHVKAFDLQGEPLDFEETDFLARIIQHELDHLNGILFPERLDLITRQATLAKWAEVRERLIAEQDQDQPQHAT